MSRLLKIAANRQQRRLRSRRQISTSPQRFRLCVFISLKHIYAQIIDDQNGRILASSSSRSQDMPKSRLEQATVIGSDIAKKSQALKIKKVALDRGHKAYHGRLRALAEAARQGGLEF